MKDEKLQALVLLFAANIISGFAQGITMLAIPWYLIHQMGEQGGTLLNNAMVAVVTLLSLIWGVYAGTLVDRYNRKQIFRTLTLIDSGILCTAAWLGMRMDGVAFPLIAAVYGTTVFTYNVHYPNLYAFVQELFDPAYYARVNSAIEIQGQSTSFLGMMLGGLLLSGSPDWAWWPASLSFQTWSLEYIFLLDGTTYFIAFLLISLIPYRPDPDRHVDTGAVWRRLAQGFRYLWDDKPLLIFGIASHLIFFSLLVLVSVAMPIYVSQYLGASAMVLASFKGFYALGAVLAGILGLSAFIRRGHAIRQIIILLVLAGGLYFLFAITHSVIFTLFAAVLIGICNAGTRILRITYIVRIVPNHVIGRVNAFFSVLNVLMRFSFISLLTIPFFAAPGNGEHIVFAFGLLGLILLGGAAVLLLNFRFFNQQAALG